MQDTSDRDQTAAGGQRNADARVNSGQARPEQQTASGKKADAERAWKEGDDTTERDTPLDAGDGGGPEVEGGYNMGTARVNDEDGKAWKQGGDAAGAKADEQGR